LINRKLIRALIRLGAGKLDADFVRIGLLGAVLLGSEA
jgi:hypothetical protein